MQAERAWAGAPNGSTPYSAIPIRQRSKRVRGADSGCAELAQVARDRGRDRRTARSAGPPRRSPPAGSGRERRGTSASTRWTTRRDPDPALTLVLAGPGDQSGRVVPGGSVAGQAGVALSCTVAGTPSRWTASATGVQVRRRRHTDVDTTLDQRAKSSSSAGAASSTWALSIPAPRRASASSAEVTPSQLSAGALRGTRDRHRAVAEPVRLHHRHQAGAGDRRDGRTLRRPPRGRPAPGQGAHPAWPRTRRGPASANSHRAQRQQPAVDGEAQADPRDRSAESDIRARSGPSGPTQAGNRAEQAAGAARPAPACGRRRSAG